MTLKHFLRIYEYLGDESLDNLNYIPKPKRILGLRVPHDLSKLRYGKLCRLQAINNVVDVFTIPAKVILGIPRSVFLLLPAKKGIGFILWVQEEVEKVNKMFEIAAGKPTKEQKEAGIKDLDFGPFGTCDWFARRMGITDHDKVMKIPWIRICECMRIDTKTASYEKRLGEIIRKNAELNGKGKK